MDFKNVAYAFWRGLYDSCSGALTILYLDKEINERTLARLSPTRSNVPIRTKSRRDETPTRQLRKNEESTVLKQLIHCGLLNGVIFLSSILIFEYLIFWVVGAALYLIFGTDSNKAVKIMQWVPFLASLLFKTTWVCPLFILSKIVNALWFQNIADSAYRHSRGRPLAIPSVSLLLADSVFSIVIESLFLIQAMLCSYIPLQFVGYLLSTIQICMLYSLYAFEYKWFNMGWELHKRLDYIETNWPYFIGFGCPLAIVTQLFDNFIISGCIFSVLFPFFIVSANEATPVIGASDVSLKVFQLVITISNVIFSQTIGYANPKLQQQQKQVQNTKEAQKNQQIRQSHHLRSQHHSR